MGTKHYLQSSVSQTMDWDSPEGSQTALRRLKQEHPQTHSGL